MCLRKQKETNKKCGILTNIISFLLQIVVPLRTAQVWEINRIRPTSHSNYSIQNEA